MTGQNHARPMLKRILNAWQRSSNAFVAGNLLAAIRQRNVEIYSNKDGLAFQVEILNRKLCHKAILGNCYPE